MESIKHKSKFLGFALILIVATTLILLGQNVNAAGTIYYVSPSGNDSNNGTSQSAPLRRIDTAFSKMSGGDTLRILAGTYNESSEGYDNFSQYPLFQVPTSISGTNSNPTIIEGYGSGTVKLTAQTNKRFVMDVQASNVTIRNLVIDGTAPNHSENKTCLYVGPGGNYNTTGVLVENVTVQNCEGQGMEFRGTYSGGQPRYSSGILRNSTITASSLYTLSNPNMGSGWQSGVKVAKYGKDIIIENNQIIDNWGEGVAITRGENVTFRNNNISNNFSVNVYLDNSINTVLENNLSYCLDKNDPNAILRGNNVATGMTIGEEYYGDSPLWGNQLSGLIMKNNVSYGCSKTLAWFGTDRGSGGGLDNALIVNNTFYTTTNTTSGIYFDGESGDDIKVYNNIFVETGNGGTAYIDNPAGNYDFKNNYWNSDPGQSQFKGSGDIYGSLNNVKFASSPSINPNSFKLLSGSSLIDKGRTVSGVDIDYSCSPRTGTPDIGAFEFGAPAGECPTTGGSSSSSSSASSSSTSSSESLVCKADYNNSGQVDIADFSTFALNYKKNSINCNLDLAQNDCYLNINDLSAFVTVYKNGTCG